MKLSEKLYELRAMSESLGGGVFVDMRPTDFRDMLKDKPYKCSRITPDSPAPPNTE